MQKLQIAESLRKENCLSLLITFLLIILLTVKLFDNDWKLLLKEFFSLPVFHDRGVTVILCGNWLVIEKL